MKGRESTYGGWVRSSTVKTVAENNGRSEVPVVVKENNKKKIIIPLFLSLYFRKIETC